MKSKIIISRRGTKYYKLPNGDFHREDGPAVEFIDGSKHWYINGKQYTGQDYKHKTRSIKLKLLLLDLI